MSNESTLKLEAFKAAYEKLEQREVIWLVDDARSHLKEKLKESRMSLLLAERFELEEDARRVSDRLVSIQKRLDVADALHGLLTQLDMEQWAEGLAAYMVSEREKLKKKPKKVG